MMFRLMEKQLQVLLFRIIWWYLKTRIVNWKTFHFYWLINGAKMYLKKLMVLLVYQKLIFLLMDKILVHSSLILSFNQVKLRIEFFQSILTVRVDLKLNLEVMISNLLVKGKKWSFSKLLMVKNGNSKLMHLK